jgi:HEAT repeat protein
MEKVCLLTLVTILVAGCAASDGNPFAKKPDETDPLYADTLAARVEQIRGVAQRAPDMSPAEKMTASTKLAEQVRTETDPVLQLEVVRALGSLPTPASIEGLRAALSIDRRNVRIAACNALTQIHSAQALEILANVAHSDSNLDVRAAAVRGLGEFRDEEALRALAVAINDHDPAIQYLAVKSMQRIHPDNLGESLSAWKELAYNILHGSEKHYSSDSDVEVAQSPSSTLER